MTGVLSSGDQAKEIKVLNANLELLNSKFENLQSQIDTIKTVNGLVLQQSNSENDKLNPSDNSSK